MDRHHLVVLGMARVEATATPTHCRLLPSDTVDEPTTGARGHVSAAPTLLQPLGASSGPSVRVDPAGNRGAEVRRR
jgi:hypothetical protein